MVKPIEIKLGYNFDPELPLLLGIANTKYPRKVTEVYGSIRCDAWTAARPDFRLPDISRMEFIRQVDMLKGHNIMMNYTLNTPDPGSKRDWLRDGRHKDLHECITMLKAAQVEWITVTHPLLKDEATTIARLMDYYPQWELSTINHLNTITQLRYNRVALGYTKVCIDLWRNRDFGWLKEATRVGDEIGMTISLLSNEFCANGGSMGEGAEEVTFTTHCSYRDSCYGCHSDNVTVEDSLLFDNYPMQHCLTSRKIDPPSWLKTRFVLPQWLDLYNEKAGVSHFKITGRTAKTPYIMRMVEAYLSGRYEGNLLELWKPLSTIWTGEDELNLDQDMNIDCSKLDNFINMWANQPDFECGRTDCGYTCRYCHDYLRHTEVAVAAE